MSESVYAALVSDRPLPSYGGGGGRPPPLELRPPRGAAEQTGAAPRGDRADAATMACISTLAAIISFTAAVVTVLYSACDPGG